jgi:hypothetical protein
MHTASPCLFFSGGDTGAAISPNHGTTDKAGEYYCLKVPEHPGTPLRLQG